MGIQHQRRERGASAVIIAMSMVLIMGVAAVVVDGGIGFSERRQAQSAVDFASLAALQAATGLVPEDAGATEAITVVAANLPGRVLDWAGCTDPGRDPLVYTIISSITPCISFTENFSQARVRLPIDAVDTTFGRIIGFNEINVRTTAEAVQVVEASADILPLTVGVGKSVCLFSEQAPQTVPPCDGPMTGFFGYLDVALHGSPPTQKDNPTTCQLGNAGLRVGINITKGADHLMEAYDPPTTPVVDDWAPCPNLSENVNHVHIQTGSPGGGINDGLIDGVSGSILGQAFGPADGRLIPVPLVSVDDTDVRGVTLDNTPLWEYLIDPNCGWSAPPIGLVDTHQKMIDCLDDWIPAVGTIFDVTIEEHKRFGAVPVFIPFPSMNTDYPIDDFVPVWIETIYQNCNAFKCDTIFSPFNAPDPSVNVACPNPIVAGDTNCGHGDTSGPDAIGGVTALQLVIEMLDPETQEFFPGSLELRRINLLK